MVRSTGGIYAEAIPVPKVPEPPQWDTPFHAVLVLEGNGIRKSFIVKLVPLQVGQIDAL
jgi:hypothetical protein